MSAEKEKTVQVRIAARREVTYFKAVTMPESEWKRISTAVDEEDEDAISEFLEDQLDTLDIHDAEAFNADDCEFSLVVGK